MQQEAHGVQCFHATSVTRRFLSHMRSRITHYRHSATRECSGDLHLLSQCVECSSADPPWKQLLRELDDPSCSIKYRYEPSTCTAHAYKPEVPQDLDAMHITWRGFIACPFRADPGPVRSCNPNGGVQAHNEISTGCTQGEQGLPCLP